MSNAIKRDIWSAIIARIAMSIKINLILIRNKHTGVPLKLNFIEILKEMFEKTRWGVKNLGNTNVSGLAFISGSKKA